MKEETINETNQLIDAFTNNKGIDQVREAQMEDPKESLGKVMLDFFNSRLTEIADSTSFKKKVRQKLEKKIDSDEMKAGELAKLLVALEEQDSIKDASVFSLLKPSQGSTNPILSSFSKKENDVVDKTNFSPEELRKFDKVYRLVQSLNKEGN